MCKKCVWKIVFFFSGRFSNGGFSLAQLLGVIITTWIGTQYRNAQITGFILRMYLIGRDYRIEESAHTAPIMTAVDY